MSLPSVVTLFCYAAAAVTEIAGCFAFWAWLRLEKPAWWILPGTVSLVLFAYFLTRIEADFAGRTYAAYGGVYIAASLMWLWFVEGQRLDQWDVTGATICLIGAAVILWDRGRLEPVPRTLPPDHDRSNSASISGQSGTSSPLHRVRISARVCSICRRSRILMRMYSRWRRADGRGIMNKGNIMTEHTHGGHGHAGHMPSSGRGLAISAWLTGIYFIIEMGIGLWTGSIAVISDAFHTFSAVGGVLVAIVAARLARRPADEDRSFGWYRAEIIGALVNGGFLLGMALVVIVMGAMRLAEPIDLPTTPMLAAAAGGLLTEFISLGLIWKESRSDLNVKGALWHIIQTFVGSLIIIVTALVIQFTGFLLIDPLLGMGFGFVLLWASWGILRDSAHLLMEGTPAEVSLSDVAETLRGVDGVSDIHHIHAWALTSGRYVFSGHVRIEDGQDPQAVLRTAHRALKEKYGFFFVTLQVETACLDESGAEAIDITREKTPSSS